MSYWAPFHPDAEGYDAHARFVRRAASAFLGTLAVEAAIHHLDLAAGDPTLAGPSRPGLAVTRQTLNGVLGQSVPTGWDDMSYALKATGRAQLTADDRTRLGALADRFPLLG